MPTAIIKLLNMILQLQNGHHFPQIQLSNMMQKIKKQSVESIDLNL